MCIYISCSQSGTGFSVDGQIYWVSISVYELHCVVAGM